MTVTTRVERRLAVWATLILTLAVFVMPAASASSDQGGPRAFEASIRHR